MLSKSSFDLGRGCPFQCSFCTIINVQGRKSRFRTPDDVEHILRQNWKQGIDRFFITDDNFARNKDWEAIFDRIIELRERNGEFDCGRLVLTHLGAEMRALGDFGGFEIADDGRVLKL